MYHESFSTVFLTEKACKLYVTIFYIANDIIDYDIKISTESLVEETFDGFQDYITLKVQLKKYTL